MEASRDETGQMLTVAEQDALSAGSPGASGEADALPADFLPPRVELRRTREESVEAADPPLKHPISLPDVLDAADADAPAQSTGQQSAEGEVAPQTRGLTGTGADAGSPGGGNQPAALFLYQQLLERALNNTHLSRAVADLLTGGMALACAPSASPAVAGAAGKFPVRVATQQQQQQQQQQQPPEALESRRMQSSRIFKQSSLDAAQGSRSIKVCAAAWQHGAMNSGGSSMAGAAG